MDKMRFINQNIYFFVWGLISYSIATLPVASPVLAQSAELSGNQPSTQPNSNSELDRTPKQSWLLLYPQHPMYRHAVEQASEDLGKNLDSVVPSTSPSLIKRPSPSKSALIGQPQPKAANTNARKAATNQKLEAANPNKPTKETTQETPKQNLTETEVKTEVKTSTTLEASTTNSPPLFIQPVEPPDPSLQRKGPKYFPSFNAGSPSGFGANWGDVFAGISLINRSSPVGSATDKADGSISIGAGFGNSQDLLGFEAVYNLISLTPSRFASNGSFDFKVHRALPDLMSVAIGWENAINYGPEAGGTPSTVYGSFSKFFVLQPDNIENPMLLGFTLGTGGGRFRSFNAQVEGKGGIGVFASAGLQVLANLSVITDWTGQNLNLGVSYVPFANLPLYVNGTLVDAVGSTSFGTRYSLGVGFGFNFR
jgi:hypothetical protein